MIFASEKETKRKKDKGKKEIDNTGVIAGGGEQ
jgi:hypothetical protein